MNYISLAAGPFHFLYLDSDLNVWVYGNNRYGSLGIGVVESGEYGPTKLEGIPPMVAVAAGRSHSIFLDESGGVWGCGANYCNQLGRDEFLSKNSSPVPLQLDATIQAICCGSNHTICLDDKGIVWAAGDNSQGQIGLGYPTPNSPGFPIQTIASLSNVVAIHASGDYSLFLDTEGSVWICGNDYSQASPGFSQYKIPIFSPSKITLPPIKYISGGEKTHFFVDLNGFIWARGGNAFGELGLGTKNVIVKHATKSDSLRNIRSCCSGSNFSLFIDEEGSVWSVGRNDAGALGLGNLVASHSPEKVEGIPPIYFAVCGRTYTLLVDYCGCLWKCGIRDGEPSAFCVLQKVELEYPILVPQSRTKSARKI